ncbi:MAG: addiction module antidote protein, HigA family [Xanthobacteraceae bacterium]
MMAMKNPAHPGELVRGNIAELGLSIAEAAKGLGVTRLRLYRVVECRPRWPCGSSAADTWLRMQMNYDLAQVRARRVDSREAAGAEGGVRRLAPKVA